MKNYLHSVNRNKPVIVQIGAHDGVLGEEYGLQEFISSLDDFELILVEPVKKFFNKLHDVYGKYDNVQYHNFAISETKGIVKMIESGGMSKIDVNGDLEVMSETWDSFSQITNINHIDLLLLDCEGYEYRIMKQIDLKNFPINVIRYEFYHIPNKNECDRFLEKNEYSIDLCSYDPIYNKIAIKRV